jgi:hypothetical protein
MGGAPKKLVTWKNWGLVLLLLVGWAGYRLYRDYQEAGGFQSADVTATIVTVCIGLALMFAVFLYANRPEHKDKP